MKKLTVCLLVCITVLFSACGGSSKLSFEYGEKGKVETFSVADRTGEVYDSFSKVAVSRAAEEAYKDLTGKTASYHYEWTVAAVPYGDVTYHNAFTTARVEHEDSFFNAWFEEKDDTLILHYFDTSDGVIFDDGAIAD